MKFTVKYFYIKSDHPLAIPQFDHKEMVEVNSEEELDAYIISQKDPYGHRYKKKKFFNFDYVSGAGGVKVIRYKEPTFKRI